MDPSGYVDFAQDLLNWFDPKYLEIWRLWRRIFVFPKGLVCKNNDFLERSEAIDWQKLRLLVIRRIGSRVRGVEQVSWVNFYSFLGAL